MTGHRKGTPPFRAEHVGSLLRPPELKQAFKAHASGDLSADSFIAIQDTCIADVVAMQESVGLRAVTDGEFRRASYWSHFAEGLEGMGVRPAAFTFHDQGEDSDQVFLAPYVEGKISRPHSLSGGEFAYLSSATKATPKITMPSPPSMHFWSDRTGIRGVYRDRAAYFADLVSAYQEEIAELGALGATYIQIDDVPLAMLCDPLVREKVASLGEDPAQLAQDYVAFINDCLSRRPDGMTVGMHLCRGNYKGKWLSEGGYDEVAELMFGETQVDAFFLEYDTPRAGDFGPLRYLGDNKTAVLGLVTTKSAKLEDKDALRARIDEAAEIVPLERLAISPQCGFSSTVAGNPITPEDQAAKLRLVVEVADMVWG